MIISNLSNLNSEKRHSAPGGHCAAVVVGKAFFSNLTFDVGKTHRLRLVGKTLTLKGFPTFLPGPWFSRQERQLWRTS
jgi:hypothetical protein